MQTAPVQGVNLLSAWPDYEFIFDVMVYWRAVDGPAGPAHVRPGAVAVDMIIRRAAEVASLEEPGMAVRLQHRLNDILGRIESDPSGRIIAWADQVRTTLSDQDWQRLRSLSEIRKDKAVWEHQRRYESDRRDYLTDDVLKSTGSAVVWWLSKNESNVIAAVDLIGTMARLSAVANNQEVPELFRHLLPAGALPAAESGQTGYRTIGSDGVSLDFGSMNGERSTAGLLTGLMDAMDMDPDERALFAERIAMDMAVMGHEDAACEIREQFDVVPERLIDEGSEQRSADVTESDNDTASEQDTFTPED